MEILKNKLQIFVSLVFISYVAWWASFQQVVEKQGLSVQRFGATYGIMALFGALIGLFASQKWGGFRTVVGKALLFFSVGLLAQEAGQIIYTYYIYGAKIQIPYPSWGDAAYFGSTLCYIVGSIYLAKAVGVKFSLKKPRYKVLALVIPAILLITSYWVFLYHHQYDWHKPLTAFLDFGYPMSEAIYISLAATAYLLSRKILGGIMRAGILILILALCIQYFADFTFLYQSSRGTWLTGRWNDLSYLVAYFVMTTAMIRFLATYYDLRKKSAVVKTNENEA